jgi:drug/metabolite transporter (DMT)-like permease
MEPGEALSTAAQVGVALAGFAGVVVAFRSRSLHEWSPMDKFRLLILLGNALVPLFACLFAMLLLTIKPTPLSIWHWCSGFSLLLNFPFGLPNRGEFGSLEQLSRDKSLSADA